MSAYAEIGMVEALRISGEYKRVAEACGVHWRTVYKWGNGDTPIPPDREPQIAAVLAGMALPPEMLALALSQDERQREYHRANIAHYKAALLSISSIVRMRAYDSTINIIGRVIAGIAIATGKDLI
jgi:DNA-binding transcriptional regulator YdaS (Cro superfamily)